MPSPIDFYFDFTSPYGYLASTRIDALGAQYGRSVRWHPILLGVVFKATGCTPLPQVPLKGEYTMHDIVRSARFHGIPYQEPREFPLATQAAARAMLWIARHHGAERAVAFAKAVYQAYFVDSIDIGKIDNVAHLASGLGFDVGEVNDACHNNVVKEMLKTEIEAAMTRGVFGSPFVIVDDEPFWGFDRFAQLEAFLKDGKI
ncbi:MAG: DsbA family protein [Proteobacteria bacterium]|nr:DsbA family protein [Pseudomonadota bacterium]